MQAFHKQAITGRQITVSRRIITSLFLIYKLYPYFFIIPFIISTSSRQLSMGVGFSKASAGAWMAWEIRQIGRACPMGTL
jgi:hypothetical protein